MSFPHGLSRRSLVPLCLLLVAASTTTAQDRQLSDDERAAGFQWLFNGQDLNGWEHGGNWRIEEGVLTRSGAGGSLVYTRQPLSDDFELRFDWKVARGSNSGVYYRPGQYEYQILDNAVHADGKNPRTSAASLYFCMAPSHDATRPIGEWNEARIICQGTVIQHWLNGQKVIDFDYDDPQWAWHVALLRNRGGDPSARGGNLSLQDHGDPVWYANIRYRALSPGESLDRTPVVPEEPSDAAMADEQRKLQRIMSGRARQQSRQEGRSRD
jgi:hypothetical protein